MSSVILATREPWPAMASLRPYQYWLTGTGERNSHSLCPCPAGCIQRGVMVLMVIPLVSTAVPLEPQSGSHSIVSDAHAALTRLPAFTSGSHRRGVLGTPRGLK